MKYIIYCLLVFVSGWLFLPKSGSTELRNVPVLITILCLIALYCVFRYIKFLSFTSKIKKELKQSGIKVQKTRLYFQKGYIVAERDTDKFDICLMSIKNRYYRYHFTDAANIEIYKTTTAISKASKSGRIAQGTPYSRLVGKQKFSFQSNNTDKQYNYILVMDKLPYSITDSTKQEELGSGEHICSSNVMLFDLKGFSKFIESNSN